MGRTYMVFECLNFEMCTCIVKIIPLYDSAVFCVCVCDLWRSLLLVIVIRYMIFLWYMCFISVHVTNFTWSSFCNYFRAHCIKHYHFCLEACQVTYCSEPVYSLHVFYLYLCSQKFTKLLAFEYGIRIWLYIEVGIHWKSMKMHNLYFV